MTTNKNKAQVASVAAANAPAKSGATGGQPAQANSAFKRTLTVPDMVIWGLICMVPISPMAIYGGVFTDSGGMPTLAFLIGFVAVLL